MVSFNVLGYSTIKKGWINEWSAIWIRNLWSRFVSKFVVTQIYEWMNAHVSVFRSPWKKQQFASVRRFESEARLPTDIRERKLRWKHSGIGKTCWQRYYSGIIQKPRLRFCCHWRRIRWASRSKSTVNREQFCDFTN